MDQHYRAFISYKHAPADIAVASEIQKRLERYHVPAAIRKKTGKDKIGRIFRDKEELPITSDLSDDISRALEDADFLIVICSSSTKLSTWVPREIDTFLKNHSKKQVLTVLVDGEPIDVIPKQLLTDTVTRTAPDGSSYEEEVVYEPLSCDFRSGMKEARRSEIPRLAAALLGCTYDELVRRERQYKRRRNLAIGIPAFFALVVAIGYLSWSRQEISKNYQRAEENYQLAQENYQLAQENYQKSEENYQLAQENYQEAQANLNKSLINQSSYLASESGKLLDKGDRLRAILLAMEALPDANAEEGSPAATRPVTATAQSAMVTALHAYVPAGTVDRNNAITTVAEFAMKGNISDYKGTHDGRYVIIRDTEGYVGVWDVASLSRIMFLNTEEIWDVRLLSDTQIVTLSDKGVSSYELPSGNKLWHIGDEDGYWPSGAIALSEEDNIVWAAEPLSIYNADYTTTYGMKLLKIDGSSGKTLSSKTLKMDEKELVSAQLLACSNDGRWAAAAFQCGYSGENVLAQVMLLDSSNDSLTQLDMKRDCCIIDSMGFFEDDSDKNAENEKAFRLAIMAYPLEMYGQGGQNGMWNMYTEVQPMEIVLSCYDTASASQLWESSYTSPQLHRLAKGKSLLYSEETRNLISLYANKAVVIRPSDGKILDEAETTTSIVSSGINSKGVLILFLDNGSAGVYHFEEPGKVTQLSYFGYDLKSCTFINRIEEDASDFLVVPEKNKCVWLCQAVYDEAFIPYEGEKMIKDTSFKGECLLGNTAAVLDYNSHLYLFDLSEQTAGKIISFSGASYQYELLGGDETAGIIWVYDKGEPNQLLALNIEDWTIKEYQSSKKSFSAPRLMPDGTFFYWIYDSLEALLIHASVKGDALEETVLLSRNDASYRYSVRPDLHAAVMEESGKLRFINIETGEEISLENELRENLKQVVWQENGTEEKTLEDDFLAITDGYEAVILKTDGSEVIRLLQTGAEIVNMAAYGDELIVLYGGGLLTRYSWQDGRMISRSKLSNYNSEYFAEKVIWDFEEDRLYLIRRDIQSLMHVIDLDTWEEEAHIQYGLGYDRDRDRIISYSNDGQEVYIGYFPHYTVEELRQKAEESLHGTELTQEERNMYGLK